MSAKKKPQLAQLGLSPAKIAELNEHLNDWARLLTEGAGLQSSEMLEPSLMLAAMNWHNNQNGGSLEPEPCEVRLQMPEGHYSAALFRHIKTLEDVSYIGSRGHKEWRRAWLEVWHESAKDQLVTISEIRRLYVVRTHPKAKKHETPEEKIERFLQSIRARLRKGDPVLEASLGPFHCTGFSDAVWLALTHPLGNDRREAMQMMTLGSAEDFLSWSLFLQGQGLNEIIVPKVWLPALREQWFAWHDEDKRKKYADNLRGRKHDAQGRFLPRRPAVNGVE